MGPEQLTIDAFVARVHSGTIRELIMATNPNLEGDGTALLIANRLGQSNLRITRLARGLASGGTLEFANRDMLSDAIRGTAAAVIEYLLQLHYLSAPGLWHNSCVTEVSDFTGGRSDDRSPSRHEPICFDGTDDYAARYVSTDAN